MVQAYEITAARQILAMHGGTGVRRTSARGASGERIQLVIGKDPVIVALAPGAGVDHVLSEAGLAELLGDGGLRHLRVQVEVVEVPKTAHEPARTVRKARPLGPAAEGSPAAAAKVKPVKVKRAKAPAAPIVDTDTPPDAPSGEG